jgi:hypothetical protein
MHMKLLGASSLVMAAVMLSAASWAQESPHTLTRDEKACQRVVGRAASSFSTDVVDCFIARQTGPSRRCDPFFPDPQTAACLDVARGRADGRVVNRCGGFACPDCYEADCDDFMEWSTAGAADMGVATGRMFCDDSSAPTACHARKRPASSISHRGARAPKRCTGASSGAQDERKDRRLGV